MTEQMTADAAPPTVVQKLAAEVIGTAVLVFIGCGAAVATGADVVATGLAFGITIVMMAYTFGRVSGGHFNPAVTVGAALAGRIAWKDTPLYAGAQVVGALIGGVILMVVVLAGDVGWEFGDPLGANGYGNAGQLELFGALLVEIVLTFIFVFVIVGVTDERNDTAAFAPLAIGLALAAVHFVGINLTGTSVNPARSIGVAWFSGGDALAQLWLFIVAPLIGGAAAGFGYPLLFGHGAAPVPGSGIPSGAATASVPGLGAPDAFQQQWNQPGGQVAAPQAQPAEQPIIQDGWQWDPASQQWIPAQQPAAPQAPQAEQPGGWAPPPGEHTVVRPPDA